MTTVARAEARGENLERVTRLFGTFVGVGYFGYLLILFGSIISEASRMADWWTPTMVVVVFVPGMLLVPAARWGSLRTMQMVAATAAATYVLGPLTWVVAWNGTHVPPSQSVWLAAFPGLAAMAAVLVWPVWVAVVYMVLGCVAVQVISFTVRTGVGAEMLVPEIAFAVMFCSIFLGGAVMALRTGRLLDETTETTYADAAAAAAQAARSVERERIDALIHDSVMSTLLVAARDGGHSDVAGLATATLAEVDSIRNDAAADEPFTPAQTVIYLRAAAADADVEARFEVVAHASETSIPAAVVRTLGAAVAEALRNSVRHAGPQARRNVTGTVDGERVALHVVDDGVGFDPSSVPTQRLGIAVSIVGRMNGLPGGSGTVESAPGNGTAVRLRWVSE